MTIDEFLVEVDKIPAGTFYLLSQLIRTRHHSKVLVAYVSNQLTGNCIRYDSIGSAGFIDMTRTTANLIVNACDDMPLTNDMPLSDKNTSLALRKLLLQLLNLKD